MLRVFILLTVIIVVLLTSSCGQRSIQQDKDKKDNLQNNTYYYNFHYTNNESRVETESREGNQVIRKEVIIKHNCVIDDIEFKETPQIPLKEISSNIDEITRNEILTNYIAKLRAYTTNIKKEHREHMLYLKQKCQE